MTFFLFLFRQDFNRRLCRTPPPPTKHIPVLHSLAVLCPVNAETVECSFQLFYVFATTPSPSFSANSIDRSINRLINRERERDRQRERERQRQRQRQRQRETERKRRKERKKEKRKKERRYENCKYSITFDVGT